MKPYLSLVAASLLTACTAGPAVSAPPGGSDWTFVAIDGAPSVSDKTSLTIREGRIGANVGCNGMGGELRIEQGRLVLPGGIISTMMYCEGLMAQEQAVAELLRASPRFFIEGGRMAIRSKDHSAELVRKSPD